MKEFFFCFIRNPMSMLIHAFAERLTWGDEELSEIDVSLTFFLFRCFNDRSRKQSVRHWITVLLKTSTDTLLFYLVRFKNSAMYSAGSLSSQKKTTAHPEKSTILCPGQSSVSIPRTSWFDRRDNQIIFP